MAMADQADCQSSLSWALSRRIVIRRPATAVPTRRRNPVTVDVAVRASGSVCLTEGPADSTGEFPEWRSCG